MARTAGSRLSWAALVALLGAGFAQACVTPEEIADDPTVQELLRDVGTLVVEPTLAAFGVKATALADLLPSGSIDEVRAAWSDAMRAWQQVEVMQIGPAASSLTAPGGEDLRDEIYSWPSVNPCRVDQVTADQSYTSDTFFDDNLVNAYGLDALEYVLWAGPDNACPSQVDLNADGTWAALGDTEVAARRTALATVLADEVVAQGEALRAAWTDGFATTLEQAADPYASQSEALDAVFHGIYYLESSTRDRKLAHPLGLIDCGAATCPDDVEAPFAGLSGAAVAENLRGTLYVFRGHVADDVEGVGFDDLLIERGHDALAEQILTDLEAAIALADQTGDIGEELQADPEAVEALYDAVMKVTTALKGDLVTALALRIPADAAGDAD